VRFKFEPVAWLTTVAAVLLAIQAADEVTGLLPDQVAGWIAFLSIVVVTLLGLLARQVSTPLAKPEAADGRTLVPTPPAKVPAGTSEEALDVTGGPFGTDNDPYEDPEDPHRGRYGATGW
jgi:hypothetical protein